VDRERAPPSLFLSWGGSRKREGEEENEGTAGARHDAKRGDAPLTDIRHQITRRYVKLG
jgi:hypothetical protein